MASEFRGLLALLLVGFLEVTGQMTTTLAMQLAGCSYKIVPEKGSCPQADGQQSSAELNSLLQLVTTQSTMIIQQQMALLQYQHKLDNMSQTLDAMVYKEQEEEATLEHRVKSLEGLIVDIEGYNGCSDLLVSGQSPIPDSAITVSSFWSAPHGPAAARIYTTTGAGCWATKVNDYNQWIKFDFGRTKKVMAILTKGRHSNYAQFVRRFKLYYSSDGANWSVYKNASGQDKVFPGNFDAESVRKNHLEPAVNARYIRINPVTWFGHISMRVDFLGCNP